MNELWDGGGGQTKYSQVVSSLRTTIALTEYLHEWNGCCGCERIKCEDNIEILEGEG